MEDSSKKSESQNAETLPPPYEGEMQEIKLTEPTYPGVVQGLGNDVPSHSGGVPQVQPVVTVHSQTAISILTRPEPPIDSYIGCSIFVLLFCCLPFGIVALVFASQSRSREAVRDFPGARQASSQAKFWSFAGFFTGLVILVGVILVVVFTT